MAKKSFFLFAFFFAVAVAFLFSGCVQTEPLACTMEAKICPDGSSVGRNPALNCEFDPCPESGEVRILLDANNFLLGKAVEFSIANDSNNSIFLPGCNPFSLEMLSNQEWVMVAPMKECFWEGNAVEIKEGEEMQSAFVSSKLQAGTYRIAVSASYGCMPGKPLSQANCFSSTNFSSIEFSIDENFTACSVNSDCILVNADCCGCNQGGKKTAINKEFLAQWDNYLSCRSASMFCPQVISNDPSCNAPAKAVCTSTVGQNGICTVESSQ